MSDITERKLAKLELKFAQQKLIEAHQLAHMGTWELVLKTDTVFWSQELYKIAGLDPSLPLPTYAEHLSTYTTDSWMRLDAAITKVLATGEPYNLELELIRPDGSQWWTNAFGKVRHDRERKIIRLRNI